MNTKRIASLLVGVAFVGGSLATYIFAPPGNYGLLLLVMWIVGMVMTWKAIWD